MGKLDLKSMHT